MSNRRFEMYQYQHVIHRMRLGDSDRQISKAGLMGRTKASEVRKSADEKGWLNPLLPMPDEAELQEVFGAPPAKPTPSKLEPYKDKVADWFNQGITGTTIHRALVRNYGFEGSYSSVRRYLETLKNQSSKATVKLVFKPGESAQVDFGKGPDLANPETGKPFKTWFFAMTLAWSRHMYAEIVPDQKVATWLGCHRRALEFFGGVPSNVRIDYVPRNIIRDNDLRNALEVLKGPHMRLDPVWEGLCPSRLCIGVVARAKHGDNDLGLVDLPGTGIDNGHGLSGVVDKQLLSGPVGVPHDRIELAPPIPVLAAKPAVLVAIWMGLFVFFPEQEQGDALSLQLLVHGVPLRLWYKQGSGLMALWREQPPMQLRLGHAFWQRP